MSSALVPLLPARAVAPPSSGSRIFEAAQVAINTVGTGVVAWSVASAPPSMRAPLGLIAGASGGRVVSSVAQALARPISHSYLAAKAVDTACVSTTTAAMAWLVTMGGADQACTALLTGTCLVENALVLEELRTLWRSPMVSNSTMNALRFVSCTVGFAAMTWSTIMGARLLDQSDVVTQFMLLTAISGFDLLRAGHAFADGDYSPVQPLDVELGYGT